MILLTIYGSTYVDIYDIINNIWINICGYVSNGYLIISINEWLVVWNMAFMTFHLLGIIYNPKRGVETTNQMRNILGE
jgi:hypothetical protein